MPTTSSKVEKFFKKAHNSLPLEKRHFAHNFFERHALGAANEELGCCDQLEIRKRWRKGDAKRMRESILKKDACHQIEIPYCSQSIVSKGLRRITSFIKELPFLS